MSLGGWLSRALGGIFEAGLLSGGQAFLPLFIHNLRHFVKARVS
jgi:hypothetical protein